MSFPATCRLNRRVDWAIQSSIATNPREGKLNSKPWRWQRETTVVSFPDRTWHLKNNYEAEDITR